MKKLFLFVFIFFLIATVSLAVVRVKGHYRQGTWVAPYTRSDPNHTVRDNYSYKGNTNPYTGKTGTNYYRNNPTSEYYQGASGYYEASPKITIDDNLAPPEDKKNPSVPLLQNMRLRNWAH